MALQAKQFDLDDNHGSQSNASIERTFACILTNMMAQPSGSRNAVNLSARPGFNFVICI
jgi:hypothetical protein